MSFAFPALFIFSLAFPGIVLRYAFLRYRIDRESQPEASSVQDEVAYSTIFAAVLHAVWCLLASSASHPVDFGSVLMLLTGMYGHDDQNFPRVLGAVDSHVAEILLYFSTLYIFAFLIGWFGRFIPHKSLIPNAANNVASWHQLFDVRWSDPTTTIAVAATINQSNGTHLFRGTWLITTWIKIMI